MWSSDEGKLDVKTRVQAPYLRGGPMIGYFVKSDAYFQI